MAATPNTNNTSDSHMLLPSQVFDAALKHGVSVPMAGLQDTTLTVLSSNGILWPSITTSGVVTITSMDPTSTSISSALAFTTPVPSTILETQVTISSNTLPVSTTTLSSNPPTSTTSTTTASSSSETSASVPKASNNNAVKAGVPAALGSLLFVTLLVLLAWYVRRKRRRQYPGAVTAAEVCHTPEPHTPIDIEKHPLSPRPIYNAPTPTFFPNIEERRSLDELKEGFTDPVGGLFDHIHSHIDKYYQADSRGPHDSLTIEQRNGLSFLKSPYMPLTTAFTDGPTPALLKHCLAFAIVSRIDFHTNASGNTDRPLLPKLVLNAYRQKHGYNRASSLQQHKDANPQFTLEQENRAEGVADACALALEPWASHDELVPRPREDDMRSIVLYAQGLGLRLFEAQETLKWDWDGSGQDAGMGEILIQPRLLLKLHRGEASEASPAGSPKSGRWEEVVAAKIERY